MLAMVPTSLALFQADPASLADALGSYVDTELRSERAVSSAAGGSFLQVAEPERGSRPANWSWMRKMDTGEDDAGQLVERRRRRGRLPAGHEIDRAVCRSRVAVDLKSAMRHEIGSTHTTNALVQEFTQSTASGIADFFVRYATVTLPNIFMDALIDVLCDIM